MFVIVAPGQGSQKPGFLEPWLADGDHRETVERWSEAINIDLIAHGTVSDEDTIKDTAIAQPLIVAAGILTGRALLRILPARRALAFAGHSVGEFTAAALAGVLSDEEALNLVAARGSAMSEASALTPTGMAAVIGGASEDLEPVLAEYGLSVANYNGGGQVVVAGTLSDLDTFSQNPPPGTRVIPLKVAGAFHTPFMASARDAVAAAASTLTPREPTHPLFTNRDGSVLTQGSDVLNSLVAQVTKPVRWDSCMASFEKGGIHGMIELAPAGALVGLAKRGMKGVPAVALHHPDDLELAGEMVGPS
jgi:[acyl-carrier-protein] S-malonyltransferase